MTRYGITHTGIQSVQIPLPSLPEQRDTVRYLDHVDRRIRRYVGTKRKLIALLEEEKQTIVSQAVTRGLDPSVRLKPSGVEWLGYVPEALAGFRPAPQISAVSRQDARLQTHYRQKFAPLSSEYRYSVGSNQHRRPSHNGHFTR